MLSKELEKKLREKIGSNSYKLSNNINQALREMGVIGAKALAEILVEELDREIKFYSAPTNFTEEFRKGNLNQLERLKTLLTGGK